MNPSDSEFAARAFAEPLYPAEMPVALGGRPLPDAVRGAALGAEVQVAERVGPTAGPVIVIGGPGRDALGVIGRAIGVAIDPALEALVAAVGADDVSGVELSGADLRSDPVRLGEV